MTQPDNNQGNMNQNQQYSHGQVTVGGNTDVATMSMLCHLLALVAFVGVPFGHVLGPLIIWLIKKDQSPEIDYHGKEALNFNICMTIYYIVAAALIIVLIGFFLLLALAIAHLVFIIIASMAAKRGERYQYPLIFRLIK